MPRVLTVSYVFPPMLAGGAVRLGQFARYLPEFGWSVGAITGEADGPSEAGLDEVVIRPARSFQPAGFRRGRVQATSGARAVSEGWLKKAARWLVYPDRQVLWVPGAIRAGIAEARRTKYDVVFASYPPASSLIAAYRIARVAGLPLVVEFRDLWGTSPLPIFASSAHRRLSLSIERRILRSAAAVIGVAPGMAHHLAQAHGLPLEQTVSITNGFDPETVALVHDRRDSNDPVSRLMYAGSVHQHYDFEPVWEAIASLHQQGVVSERNFRLIVLGNLDPAITKRPGLEGLVEIRPMVSHREVFAHFAEADALLMIEREGYYKDYGYAAKVFDYVLTGKPVLALVEADSNSERLLLSAGVGVIARPNDAPSVERRLRELLGRHPIPVEPVAIDEAPLAAFDRRNLTAKLAAVLERAARGQAP